MRLNDIFLASLIFFSAPAFAQNCDDQSIINRPGTWTEGLKGSTSGISANDLATEKKVVAALHAMIKSKFSPMGVDAVFSGAFESPYSAAPGNIYSYNIYPLNFYCDGNNLKTVHETSTYFSIRANMFDAEIYDSPTNDNPEGFFSLTDMPIEKDGYYLFKEKEAILGLGIKGKSSAWLVTYAGKLPFAYVSKKDFLLKRKQILADQLALSASSSKDVLNNIEIEKKFKETELKNDPEKLQKYMRMAYEPTKERYEKLLAENEKNYDPAFAKIEALLKMSAAELSEPAIVKIDPNDHLSYLFTDDNDPFGKVLIQPNPLYFNKKLPRSSPQFFSVYIAGNDKDPVASKTMSDIVNAVDFSTLRNMLGK